MSDLIKRKDAIKLVKRALEEGVIPAYYLGLAPTIDAVIMVRCKDCSYWASHDLSVNWCLSLLTNTKADDYCSYGERKESE